MADYSKTTNFTAKDALSSGDPNKIIKGSEHDTEFDNIATMSQTKSNKVAAPTSGNVSLLTGTGDYSDSGFSFSNLSGAVLASNAEIDTLVGITANVSELNTLDGITSNVGELNALDGLAASVVVVTDASGLLTTSITTETDMTYLANTESNIQLQFNNVLDDFKYIWGLEISNSTIDTLADLNIAAGTCTSDDVDEKRLTLATGVTRQLDAEYGTGNGGLAVGLSETISTWYHVFLIEKDSDESLDVYFDTSITAANIPTGFTRYRRIGSFYNDASGHLASFTQDRDKFTWVTPDSVGDWSGSSGNQSVHVPPDIKVTALLGALLNHSGSEGSTVYGAYGLVSDTAESWVCSKERNFNLAGRVAGSNPAEVLMGTHLEILTNTSQQIKVSVDKDNGTTGTGSISGGTFGYLDTRGRI